MSSYFLVEDHELMRHGVIDYLSSHGNYVCT
jgi:DNA-binding NarL/FixJ family response regulator